MPTAARPRLHVLGNAGVDIILTVARAPLDGETLIARAGRRAPGGKGLNQAVVAARAGASVRFQAPVGDDAEAAFIREALAREPIAALSLKTQARPTDLSVIIVDDAGGNRIVSTSDCADAVTEADAAAFAASLGRGDMLAMQGNLSRAAIEAAAACAVARGATVLLNLAPFRWMPPCAVPDCWLIVNRLEATQACGIVDPSEAALALCRAGARIVVVTLGADGCVVCDGATCRHFPAPRAAVVDTTGAGDTFCGVLAAALLRGSAIGAAIDAAQVAAALTVSRAGAFDALPRADELAR